MRNKVPLDRPEQHAGAEPEQKETAPINWLGIAATLVSAAAVTLTLLGYGVSFALEAEFGIPHASVFESALDLTDLAGYAIAQLLNHTGETLFHSKLYSTLYLRTWPQLLVGVLLALSFAGLAHYWARKRKGAPPVPTRKPRARPANKDVHLRNGMLAVALGISLMPIISAAIVVVICALFTLVALAPMLGLVAGRSYITEWVVTPASCAPSLSRQTRIELEAHPPSDAALPKEAACVILTKDANEVGRGRVAVMTTKSVVLFDPATGAVRRVPTSTSVVRMVSTLEPDPDPIVSQAPTPPSNSPAVSGDGPSSAAGSSAPAAPGGQPGTGPKKGA